MTAQLQIIIDKIKELEKELINELQKQEEELSYKISKHKIHFDKNIAAQHKLQAKRIWNYLKDSPFKIIVSTPFIWMCLFPFLFLDVVVSLYQLICFPIYGIPKVKRQDYIIFDRQYLGYLNSIEIINCCYCSYANGLIAYVQEIAARTEQYWCPIKHARHLKTLHSRYQKFINYGEAEHFKNKIEAVRRDFSDLQEDSSD